MSDDALSLFQAMRPTPPSAPNGDIQPASSRGSRELHDLAMVPGSPGYRARIPAPPCAYCGEDHFPGRSYDHAWTEAIVQVHDEPVAASAIVRRPTTIEAVPTLQAFRVALYVGRGDTYVISVEVPPDWDQAESWKVKPEMVLPLINLARALGQKVVDKTGGDLLMLEQENVSQHAQDHGRGAASPGGGGARRSGPAASGPQESLEAPDERAD